MLELADLCLPTYLRPSLHLSVTMVTAWVDNTGRGRHLMQTPPHQDVTGGSLRSFPSAEKLILNMTNNGDLSQPEEVMVVHDPDVNHGGQGRQRTKFHRQPSVSSLSSLPGARLETSFGVNHEEPQTRILCNPIVPPVPTESTVPFYGSQEFQALSYISQPRVIATDQSIFVNPVSLVSSVDNIFERSRSEEPVTEPPSRFYSMSNVNEVGPVPENRLGQRHDSASTMRSSCTLVGEAPQLAIDSDYGYTVVLASAPKQQQGTPYSRLIQSQPCNVGGGSVADSGYGGPASDTISVGSSRPDTPPPYVGPPSYSSLYGSHKSLNGPANTSGASYVSARSQPALDTSASSRESPAYMSACSNPGSAGNPRGSSRSDRVREQIVTGRPPLGYSSLPRARTKASMAESFIQAVDQSTPHGIMKRHNSSPSKTHSLLC